MDERLREAAHEGNIERLYALIREDPIILEHNIDDILLADTPLHVAASTGNLHFAAEVMRLKPSYARKFNLNGLSPIHLALRNGYDHMVEWFVSVDSNLVRDNGGEGMTSLHYVIAQGNVNLLRLFLLACPDSIEDLTTKRETALHIALRYYDPMTFETLVGWLKKVDKEDILNWPDDDGHTVLHMATSNNRIQAVKLLLSKKFIGKIKVNAKTKMGLTALDIFQLPMELDNREIGDMLCRAKALRGISINHNPLEEIDDMSLKEKLEKYFEPGARKKSLDKDMCQAVLTVAVLIATATFQAVLSPPGGLWQDDYIPSLNGTAEEEIMIYIPPPHISGTSTMTPTQFFGFYFLNSVTFYATMSIIYLHTEDLILLNMSQIFLCATYCCSLILISPIVGYIHLLNMLYEFIIMVTQLLFFYFAFSDVSRLQKYSIRLAELIVVPYTSRNNTVPNVVFFQVVPLVLIFLIFTSTFFVGFASWWYTW